MGYFTESINLKKAYSRVCEYKNDTETIVSIGKGGGYYGGSAIFYVDKNKDTGAYEYSFYPSGWDFSTGSQLEAAAILISSNPELYQNEELKKVEFVEPDDSDIEYALYWLTGGNSIWRFGSDEELLKSWEDVKEEIIRTYGETLKDNISNCTTLYDLCAVLKKNYNDDYSLYADMKGEFPEWFMDTDEANELIGNDLKNIITYEIVNEKERPYLKINSFDDHLGKILSEDGIRRFKDALIKHGYSGYYVNNINRTTTLDDIRQQNIDIAEKLRAGKKSESLEEGTTSKCCIKNKKTRLLKEATEYEVPDEVKSFNGNFVVAVTGKGNADGMPSVFQVGAFRKYENFKKWIDSMKFAVFAPKSFFKELAETGEGRFSTDDFFFVVKMDKKCKDFYLD